jgi:multiple sugar transport system ATP-binding protein
LAELQFEGVWKRWPDGTEAVKDLNLEIEDGELMVLVGPSGCGKSTILRMVAGLEEITAGNIVIGDRIVNKLSPKERDVAMVFQSYALYPHMTVTNNMGFGLRQAKVPKPEIHQRVSEAAEILGLTEYLERKPKALSGGQRQRVAMGRAIVREPKAFLMDEPLSNLDAKLRGAMRAEIAQLQARLGTTMVYVTHDQVEAMTMGNRVAVLKQGILQQVAHPQALYENPDDIFVAGFIGSPAMNLAEGIVDRSDGGMTVRVGKIRLSVDDDSIRRYPGVKDVVGRTIAVGMRPEHFFRPDGSVPDQHRFRTELSYVEALGSEMLVHFDADVTPLLSEHNRQAVEKEDAVAQLQKEGRLGGGQFVARFEPGTAPAPGELIDIGFKPGNLHFFDLETGGALR